ncbi:hypothetical protein NUW54_g10462 [Trametes sanguinea]|uniref:Uncharacterized protein n=1 Tax=Trametes sanguinea TaxID=158606 RepID=A0ACC1P0F8_9APHY|nr:hypothetical protein NUW54_g10462 [Trametes sanguinea]
MDSQNTFGAKSGGFFIKAFTQALRKNPHQTHTELLHSIRGELAKRVADHNMKLRKKGMVLSPEEEAISPRAQVCIYTLQSQKMRNGLTKRHLI